MNEHRREFAITLMCQVLEVARAGFYQWVHQPLSERHQEDQRLLGLIKES
jgi:putative transposase